MLHFIHIHRPGRLTHSQKAKGVFLTQVCMKDTKNSSMLSVLHIPSLLAELDIEEIILRLKGSSDKHPCGEMGRCLVNSRAVFLGGSTIIAW